MFVLILVVLRAHWSSRVRLLLGCSVWGAEGCEREQRGRTGFVWRWPSDWGMCLLSDKSQDCWFQHQASWAKLIHAWPCVPPHPSSLPLDGIYLLRCQTFCARPALDTGWEPGGLAAAIPLGDWSYCPVSAGVGGCGFLLSLFLPSPSFLCVTCPYVGSAGEGWGV